MYSTFQFQELIDRALQEDIGTGDLSTRIFPEDLSSFAKLYAKEEGVVAGLSLVEQVFQSVDPRIKVHILLKDGEKVNVGDVVIELEGPLSSILQAERTALNFLQHLSGIATATNRAVDQVAGLSTRIVDTRKTLPGWRSLQKYAVRVGGGQNHRFGLYDAVMLKDNHLAAVGGLSEAVQRTRDQIGHMIKIEVECETIEQVKEAVACGVDVIMLDNMGIEEMRQAVLYINQRAIVEASGGIREQHLRQVAETGVDLISIGALTHSVKAMDFSLDLGEIKATTRANWEKGIT
ncbi:carboxylating nicotinate-nucleotide diphosphorylase [Desulfosporosinus sp.]|uniref:carboxylating nicotinate-nucleotide diphosphorylase n=1 Tax=Desulfosporosinus sp. TaxID=157907 RepID=UPI000E997306|nr:carboxylating nicotinate-nucleotide diphosphorylase [Desulfosporosinus sp.]MBC2722142.1 carboxylating nicotinate-nucleotide diphosphorylase [Desulfosporosinus sp.]MBC2727804.1 carboxylating nicotinate-nucleotide diphosphorylase [Desulfosporosinus sp.]HBV86555.1 carboxylating nicotinate-nucleotide diphosphorylase [Desulfosporosinus sp.]